MPVSTSAMMPSLSILVDATAKFIPLKNTGMAFLDKTSSERLMTVFLVIRVLGSGLLRLAIFSNF